MFACFRSQAATERRFFKSSFSVALLNSCLDRKDRDANAPIDVGFMVLSLIIVTTYLPRMNLESIDA